MEEYISSKKMQRSLGLILVLVIIFVIFMFGFGKDKKTRIQPNPDKYQAVFLSNSQVYFGKLALNDNQYVLTDVFYVQNPPPAQSRNDDKKKENDIRLVKFGNEFHGPEDAIIIEPQNVLFWENLRATGKIAEGIKKYKARTQNTDGANDSAQEN